MRNSLGLYVPEGRSERPKGLRVFQTTEGAFPLTPPRGDYQRPRGKKGILYKLELQKTICLSSEEF